MGGDLRHRPRADSRSRMSAPTTIAAGVRLTVVGDVMLDEYIFGEATPDLARGAGPGGPRARRAQDARRRSPLGRTTRRRSKPRSSFARSSGRTATAGELERLLSEAGVSVSFVSSTARGDDPQDAGLRRPSPGRADRLRDGRAGSTTTTNGRLAAAIGAVAASDVILVSDYAKGSITESVMSEVRALARTHAVPVIVDPKASDWSLYRGVDVLKPNAAELGRASDMPTRRRARSSRRASG